MRLFKSLAFFASGALMLGACELGFDSDSFQNKAGAYFKEMTSTAAVASYSLGSTKSMTDKNGNICFDYDSDKTISFTLRNPQHYTFTIGKNMTLTLAGNNGRSSMPLSNTVVLKQDSSDTTKLYLTFPAEFLKANPLGANISPVITMMHPVSLVPFTPYEDLKLSSNATPPMPNGAVAMQTSDTPSKWVVCFNMPNAAIIDEFHRDLESISVNNNSAKVSVSGGVISLEGGGAISSTAPAGLVANQNTGLSFSPNGQAVYYSTGDEADEKERVYTVKVTDNAGLVSSFGISTRGFKLSAPDAYLIDDTNFAHPFDTDYAANKNFISQEEDGSSFISLHGIAKTEAVTYTDSSGNTQTIPQTDYDPSNAQILYEVYLEDTFTTLVDSGIIKGLTGKIPVPAGTSYVRAYVRKPLYSDSEVVTWWCRAVSTRFFVSETGDDVLYTGSRDKPYRTIQKAVSMFGEGIYQGDYDPDCACQIKVLSAELTPPSDFDFALNGGAYINIPDPASVPTMPLSSATINIEGDGGAKTVNLSGRNAKLLIAECGNVVLTDINLTGADFSAAAYNEALVEIASAASVRMNSVAISKNKLTVAATSAINIVKNSGTLRMNDSSVAENTRGIDGSTCVVLNCDGGETTLSNTSILNHHEDWTPAFIAASATFDMTGGEIKDNTESNYIIESNGLVTMTGVTVQNNGNLAASSGIHIVGNKMTLKDCVITKNKADCGAGIMVEGELVLDSCSITENTAADDGAGVFCSSSATKISLKGKNTVYDNHTVSEPAKQNNIYLDDNATPPALPTLKLFVEDDISGSKIGLHYPEAIKPTLSVSVPFTSGYNYGTKNKEKPGACFSSDYNYGISDISSNEAAFVVSSGSMYDALDYNFVLGLKEADGAAASCMYFGSDAVFAIDATVTRKEPGSGSTPTPLYLNTADKKLYLDPGFTNKAAGDKLVSLAAALYNGSSKVCDLDVTWGTNKITVEVPASSARFPDNYIIKIYRNFLGVDSSAGFDIACNHSAEAAAYYIKGLSSGTYTVEVEGVVGPAMDYSTDEITAGDQGLAKVAKAIKNAAGGVWIVLDARETSYVPSSDPENLLSNYNDNSYFAGCTKLKEMYLPEWLQFIVARNDGGNYVGLFEGCSGLTKIELTDSVKLLMPNAFKGCTALASITLPKNVSGSGDDHGIMAGAFVDCKSGFKINYAGTREQWGKTARGSAWHDGPEEPEETSGSVTCTDGKCGFDWVVIAYPDVMELPDGTVPTAADYPQLAISSAEGFDRLASWSQTSALAGIEFTLLNNVTVSDNLLIKQFRGTFDGNGKSITQNFTLSDTSSSSVYTALNNSLYSNTKALFWSIEKDATIKNLTVKGSATRAGLVANMFGGTIEDCVSEVDISDSKYWYANLGGFVSSIRGSDVAIIKNCVFKGTINTTNPGGSYSGSGTDEAGGIAASVDNDKAIIDSCINKGVVGYSAANGGKDISRAGGIVGYTDSKVIIRNCKNMGTVCGDGYTAGIVSFTDSCSVINCSNVGVLAKYNDSSEKTSGLFGTVFAETTAIRWPTLKNNCNVGDADVAFISYFRVDGNNTYDKPDTSYMAGNYSIFGAAPKPTEYVSEKSDKFTAWTDLSFDTAIIDGFTSSETDYETTRSSLNGWVSSANAAAGSTLYKSWKLGSKGPELDLGALENK